MTRRPLAILALGLACAIPADGQSALRFVDRSRGANLDLVTWSGSTEKPHILESTGNGVLTLDYDGDGYQDLYLVAAYRLPRSGGAEEHSALYRNLGDGTFEDVSERAGVAARVYGHGGCVGDPDADGRPDLYVTAFGANLLYRNRGDGTFREAASEAGVADPGWGIGCAFLDADADGDQDLFVGNYIRATWDDVRAARRTRLWRGRVAVMDGPRGLPEGANVFFRNRGDGTFADETEAAGLEAGGLGYTMGVASLDYDLDGDTDLYLANDSTPNRLYRNSGDGRFEEVGAAAGVAYDGDGELQGSMGVGVGDLDGDARPDLVVTNFAHDHYTLYRNLGRGLFRDDSFAARLALPTFAPLGWAAVPFDADNDRDLDLFFANGHIYPQVDDDPSLGERFRQPNQLLQNDRGSFRDVSRQSGDGLAPVESSRGAVAFDVENDGDLDLIVSNQDAPPSLLVNESAVGHWLALDLRRSFGPRRPLGARVEVEVAGGRQAREVASGGSYTSEGDPRLHWGLGEAESLPLVRIVWPGGERTELERVPMDRILVFQRGGFE